VEPLWWVNPLDYAYSEINSPKHMKQRKPIYEDSDGDGVLDDLDKEPNTPAGCPVDSHGISKDTDGDGVPDCKDKQLITPTECQPVDADGVGKCPEPECCKTLAAQAAMCNIGNLPSISFKNRSAQLSNDAKTMLSDVASRLKNNANCNITLSGYPAATKASQALCNQRLDAIKTYLTEKEGISSDRITANCEVGGGDTNTVDIKAD
jgi:outer membrane protein OmpA-like peptidoglycan-associated protein